MNHDMQRLRGFWQLSIALVAASLFLMAAGPATTPMPPDIAMPILGRQVFSPEGNLVCRIVDVLVNGAGQPQAAVLDVGGFLGVGNRVIAVHWSTLHFNPANHDHPITVDMPGDEIKAAPEYSDPSATAQVVVPHPASPEPPATAPTAPAPTAPAPAAPAAPAPAAPTPAAPPPAPPASATGGTAAPPAPSPTPSDTTGSPAKSN